MKPSDLLNEVGATPAQPNDPVMNYSPGASGPSSDWLPPHTPMNDTEHVSPGPQASKSSQYAQKLKGAGKTAAQGLGAIKSGIGSVLDKFERGRQGAVQGWTASRQANAGQEQAGRIAQDFINKWNQSIGQDPSLNSPGYLQSFAERIAPELVQTGQIYEPTDMSAVGVSKYIKDIVAKDLAANALYGGDRPEPTNDLTAKAFAQAKYEQELEKARRGMSAKPNPEQIAQAFAQKNMSIGGEKLNPNDPLTQKIMTQLSQQGSELHNLEDEVDQLASQMQRQPAAESRNFSGILWRQMRDSK